MATFLMIGAHPDDMDLRCGGLASRLHAQGHQAVFLSMTNGNAGHMSDDPAALRLRRLEEMRRAALEYGGIRYETMDVPDGYLTPDIPTRDRLIRYIRALAPDVIITHRSCDYHPDHRACGQLVNDSSYLVGVPLVCPDVPALRSHPAILFCEDRFTSPAPFRPDVCAPCDGTIEQKICGVLAHVSQFYEWLPYDGHWEDVLSCKTEREMTKVLDARLRRRFSATVRRFPDRFPEGTTYGEAFQLDEYGGPLTDEMRAILEGGK